MTQYIGITIGPIVDTMMLTSTPAGLWAASYLFSELSKRICKRLPEGSILTPYYEDVTKGVGLFPDRIILKQGDLTPKGLQDFFDAAIDEVAELLCMPGQDVGRMQSYLREYIQVHAVAFETDKNPIGYSNSFLAAAELEHSFAGIEKNTLLRQFEWREDERKSKNKAIKESKLVEKILGDLWPLWDKKNPEYIRDLAGIASDDRATYVEEKQEYIFDKALLKKHRYYAVIQADGDNIGKHICKEGLSPEDISKFSKKCWNYSQEAAKKVGDFGGVPIYVGGDDLLAIVPVENAQEQNVFWLLQQLRGAFEKEFGKGADAPTLSFGVSIQYYKFPLYESFNQAYRLLKGIKYNVLGKNAIALRLQKHSGQSVELVINGGQSILLTEVTRQIDALPRTKEDCEKANLLLHSVMTHLHTQRSVFSAALERLALRSTFQNVFHEAYTKQANAIEAARKLLALCRGEKKPLETMDQLLRLQKFFVELGEEENHG